MSVTSESTFDSVCDYSENIADVALGALQHKYNILLEACKKLRTHLQTAERREALLVRNVLVMMSEAVVQAACLATPRVCSFILDTEVLVPACLSLGLGSGHLCATPDSGQSPCLKLSLFAYSVMQ